MEQVTPGGAQIHPLRKKIDHKPPGIVVVEDADADTGSAIDDIKELEKD